MADIKVLVCKIENLRPHPNADKLEIVDCLGWQCVVSKGKYQNNDKVLFIPPRAIIPTDLADSWGITNYLQGKEGSKRVGQINLRGIKSFGLIIDCPEVLKNYSGDLKDHFGITKYDPPIKTIGLSGNRTKSGQAISNPSEWQPYTDIENARYYLNAFKEGESVVITEKIHGMNAILFATRGSFDRHNYYASSRKLCRKEPVVFDKWHYFFAKHFNKIWKFITGRRFLNQNPNTEGSVFWQPYKEYELKKVFKFLFKNLPFAKSIYLYGEIYGPGVQYLPYDAEPGKPKFKLFDIKINGTYLDWPRVQMLVEEIQNTLGIQLPTVPVLYEGPFNWEFVKTFSSGSSTLNTTHIREGCVIKPTQERIEPGVGRLILKYINDDYLMDKKAEESDVTEV